jgi:hypothetical protein
MCGITEIPDRHTVNAPTRADARFVCMWRHQQSGGHRYRNCYPTLAAAVAHLARHPDWGPDHVWDARHGRIAFVVAGDGRVF